MDILNTISTTTDAVSTIFRISTFEWDKKTLKRIAMITLAFAGVVTIVQVADSLLDSK